MFLFLFHPAEEWHYPCGMDMPNHHADWGCEVSATMSYTTRQSLKCGPSTFWLENLLRHRWTSFTMLQGSAAHPFSVSDAPRTWACCSFVLLCFAFEIFSIVVLHPVHLPTGLTTHGEFLLIVNVPLCSSEFHTHVLSKGPKHRKQECLWDWSKSHN